MPLQPSRRDTIGSPPRDVSDLAAQVRHQTSYLRSLDPGIQEGRWATPKPVPKGPPRQLVGGDAAGDDTDYAWEYDDRHTITTAGTQAPRLSHIPIDESLHVFWHPGGDGGLRLTSEYFTVDDQIVTIPDPGYFALGDTFSFQYEYEIGDDVLDFEFVGVVAGVFNSPANTLTFDLPPEVEDGDFLVASCRGGVAPGGGDITLGFTSGDSRLSVLHTVALPVSEVVLTGFANASAADVIVNVTPNLSYSPNARGVLAIFRGVNAAGTVVAASSGVTPQVAAIGAVAITWDGNQPFTVLSAFHPTSYTEAGNTGADYSATDISYWTDPAGETSPAGTFTGEGCLVIALV